MKVNYLCKLNSNILINKGDHAYNKICFFKWPYMECKVSNVKPILILDTMFFVIVFYICYLKYYLLYVIMYVNYMCSFDFVWQFSTYNFVSPKPFCVLLKLHNTSPIIGSNFLIIFRSMILFMCQQLFHHLEMSTDVIVKHILQLYRLRTKHHLAVTLA